VILALMEESGGAQIGPFHPWNPQGDTIHRDKDTCALAVALFNLGARMAASSQSVLDFYLEMAEQLGGLAYFERLDAYLPDKAVAENPGRAEEANAVKTDVLTRLVGLSSDHHALLSLLGYQPELTNRLPDTELASISLLVKRDGVWQDLHPTAHRYQCGSDTVEFYRAGVADHDGMRINVRDASGAIRHWCLVRASGTEAVLRVYMEIVEPKQGPQPARLADTFEPLLCYLGLDRYRLDASSPDYVSAFRATVSLKYP
jgi:phosphomannomutase